ncbi:antirestriction protein, partial [Erwinia sp. OLMDLW33]
CEWNFVALENGGGFMQPDGDEWHFSNPDNGAEMTLSAEAAGIVITAMVLNHRSWFYDRHDEPELCEHYCGRFRQLTGFISAHPEYGAIWRALN